MMILLLVAMTGLEKCNITSAHLQWLFHSGEQAMARGPFVIKLIVTGLVQDDLVLRVSTVMLFYHSVLIDDSR